VSADSFSNPKTCLLYTDPINPFLLGRSLMLNCSSVLDHIIWGAHLNFEGHLASSPSCPSWLTQLQRQDWQRRGIVVWDAGIRVVAHLYAGFALELLDEMQANDAWQFDGFLIGSPTSQLSSETVDGTVTLKNQFKLASDQAKDLFDFLSLHKKSLKYIANSENEEAEDALRTVFRLIASYGRKVREGNKVEKPVAITKPSILPTFIPHGSYFTVPQAAQMCNATSKQIRAWIRKRKIDALDLPGLGIIIEAEKLHQFIHRKVLDRQ
jgi:hypothetical protein